MSRPRSERPSAGRALSSLTLMIVVAAVLGAVVAGLAIPFAGLAGMGAQSVARNLDDLPAELDTEALAQKTRVLDSNGDLIATLFRFDGNRRAVSLDRVSRIMVKSIVGIEDYRFYQHGALDLKGTLRALITNQASGSQVQGGSSITQQLVKLTRLDQAKTKAEQKAATEDTFARKIQELRYAIGYEQQHSKDWILERYLNTAYFGDGAFGIQAAARHYFNVDAGRLKLPQAAVLAGMVKNPTGYDPTNYPDRTITRRNVVLDRLAQLHVITQTRADNVSKRPLGLNVQRRQNGCVSSKAQFFCDYVVRYLESEDGGLGKTLQERRRLLFSGGLTVRTTLDMQDQQAAQEAVNNRADPTDEAIAAMAMVEPGTGKVRAVAQSRPMGDRLKKGETYLNYVIPQELGNSACCQAGSNFKPFVLATAINDGIPLNTKIPSPQELTLDLSKFANCPGEPGFVGTFPANNSTGAGTFDLYSGTQKSVNTFFYQLEERTGVCNPFNLARAMGIRLTSPAGEGGVEQERVPSFVLGVATVSPLEVAEAYATFAARGRHCDSRPVSSIRDSNGTLVLAYPDKCTPVMPQSTADAVNDILQGVQEPGGFGYDIGGTGLSVPSAAKTGTAQETQAVWFSGYTPQLATSAMVGGLNAQGQPDELPGKVIKGYVRGFEEISGSGFAGPMWGDAMHRLDDEGKFDDIDFVKPDPLDVQGVQLEVPDVSGLSPVDATRKLQDAGFAVAYGGTRPSRVDRGEVAYSYPAAGQLAPSDSTVTIYESAGPRKPGGKGGRGGKGGKGGR